MDQTLIAVAAGDIGAAFDLKDWLDDVSDLRGRSSVDVQPTALGEQGGVTDVLVVALGSGGVVTVLSTALTRWLSRRQVPHTLKVSVVNGKKSVTIEVDQTTDSVELATQILKAIDEHHREP